MNMADRHRVLLDSVKKLVNLGVSDEEIIMHLTQIGVSEKEARQVLAEAKGQPASVIPQPEAEPEPSAQNVLQSVQSDLGREAEPDSEPVSDFEQEPSFSVSKHPASPALASKPVPMVSRESTADLWEKGILQTVTEKLQEMKQLHDELESLIDKKIEKALAKEIQKMDTLVKSQQTLLLAKMNASLEKKTGELTEFIDAKIAELKKLKDDKKQQETVLETKQTLAREIFEKLSQELDAVKKQRNQSLQEFNAELIKVKSRFEETIEDARQKLVALEERATQTLELETAIIEGMVKDAQNRIDRLAVGKIDDLAKEVRQSITEFEALKTGFDLEAAQKQLQQFETVRHKIENESELAAQSLSERMEARLEKELQPRIKQLQSLDTQLKETQSLKAELQKELERAKAKAPSPPQKNAP